MLMPISTSHRRIFFAIAFIIIAAVGLYGLLPQFGSFQGSWQVLQQASWPLVALAAALSLVAALGSAVVYMLLSIRPLRFVDVSLIQLSGLCINRVFPAGIGGLGLNFLYLRNHRHTAAQAGAVVALNNLFGFIGHGLLACVFLIMFIGLQDQQLVVSTPILKIVVVGVCIVAIAAFGLAALRRRKVGHKVRRQVAQLITQYRRRPGRVVNGLIASCVMTLLNVAAFWVSCRALDITVGLAAAFTVFTFGVAAATATPTPGGLGGAELGLAAGLVSLHVPTSQAIAAALLYRLVSFWLGLFLGALAFVGVQQRHLLNGKLM